MLPANVKDTFAKAVAGVPLTDAVNVLPAEIFVIAPLLDAKVIAVPLAAMLIVPTEAPLTSTLNVVAVAPDTVAPPTDPEKLAGKVSARGVKKFIKT